MGSVHIRILIILFTLIFFCHCQDQKEEVKVKSEKSQVTDSNQVTLEFTFDIDRKIYRQTNFGDPPQLAVWIENPDFKKVRTVWVARCTARQEWKGRIECLVSLPYWESRIGRQIDRVFTPDPEIDLVTGATPKNGTVTASIEVSPNSKWDYYIEINVSADYNASFTYWSKDGMPDSEENGQPSLVYSGQIVADGKSKSSPALVGRTEQRRIDNKLLTDLSGITTAKHLIGNLEVRSRFR